MIVLEKWNLSPCMVGRMLNIIVPILWRNLRYFWYMTQFSLKLNHLMDYTCMATEMESAASPTVIESRVNTANITATKTMKAPATSIPIPRHLHKTNNQFNSNQIESNQCDSIEVYSISFNSIHFKIPYRQRSKQGLFSKKLQQDLRPIQFSSIQNCSFRLSFLWW